MSDDAAVLWVGEGPQGRPQEDAARALTEWGRARGVRLVPAQEPSSALSVDLSLGDRIEKEIDRAREAIASADADTAERALARVESILREHPELPQAAWLRAEAERTWSARWLRIEPRDEARARVAWENAHALDGGRVAGIGETRAPPRARVKTTIIVTGARGPRLSLRLDGIPVEPADETDPRGAVYRVEVVPTEHHLHATADGRVLFASWVAIAGPTPTFVTITDGGACGREQLSAAKLVGEQIQAPGVTCPRWVAAVPGERAGSILVARCENDTCGPLLEWRVERYGPSGPPQAARGLVAGWPTWATWTLVGIGAATATSMALIATGVFESRPVEPRFTVGGARQE